MDAIVLCRAYMVYGLVRVRCLSKEVLSGRIEKRRETNASLEF